MGEISFQHVKKKYANEQRYSVEDFTLDVENGEFLVLVGPSGCGKSTLLRMLAGLEEITEGEIYIGDRLVNYLSSKDRNIAMVFQNYALYPHMTVYENIAFGLRIRKLPKHEIHERVMRAAKVLEIEVHLQKLPRQLSGGQRQRVALGRAIMREPEVFLMDEPLSNLDAKLRVQMREEITKLHRKLQTTIIYVTHDQIEAMTMGTRIVVMRNGKILQVGTPKEIYNTPSHMFVAGFMGSPPMNFLHGQVRARSEGVMFETKRYALSIPADMGSKLLSYGFSDKPIILGIRAEHIGYSNDEIEDEPYSKTQFSADVDLVEFMGADTFLHVNNHAQRLVVRVDPLQFQASEGDTIYFGIDMGRAHFFNPNTEERIC